MVRTSKVSQTAAEAGRRSQIASKKAAIQTLCQCIHQVENNNGGKLPYGYMKAFVTENKKTWEWMSRDTMVSAYLRYKAKLARQEAKKDSESPMAPVSEVVASGNKSTLSDLTSKSSLMLGRTKGGRPIGSTKENKRLELKRVMDAKNEIAKKYRVVSDEARRKQKNVRKGYLSELIKEVKKRRKIEHINIPLKTIYQRAYRKQSDIHHCPGHISPLLPIEDTVVQFIIKMAEIRQSLTPSRGLALINSLISEMPIQKDLEEWKKKFSNNESGSVGKGYWRSFLKRNAQKIVSKRGQKYELDRQNCTTYANFVDMYDQCIAQMVRAGVAKKRATPVWLNSDGKECCESEAFGCKMTHDLVHPDWCIVGDELGGNISMKGDGHAGGRLYLAAKGRIAYRKYCKSDRKFTLIGLTSLTGQPVMCIVVIQGIMRNRAAEIGIDVTIQPDGNPTDADFFMKNSGPGKYFPGAPVCHFRGKEIPPLVRWSESGSITSEILADVLKTLDALDVYPRSNGNPKPFLLVDGHQSRLQLPFLRYINEPEDNWVVCLGVPYGTALWQVGDSKEQNGSFNISMTKAKVDLLELKESKCMNGNNSVTDIIPLINRSWNSSFARFRTNQNAICERGWFPLNRNLLMMPEVRSTMTDKEREYEMSSDSNIILPSLKQSPSDLLLNTAFSDSFDTATDNASITNDSSTASTIISSDKSKVPSLNFNTGTASFVLDAIVQQEDLLKARERIKREREDGQSVSEKLKKSAKITAGVMWKCGTNHLGRNLLDLMKEDQVKKMSEEKNKLKKAESTYLKQMSASDKLIMSGKSLDSLSIKDLTLVVKPFKRNGDKALPKKKKELIELYEKWKLRPRRKFDYTEIDQVLSSLDGHNNDNDNDDANIANV